MFSLPLTTGTDSEEGKVFDCGSTCRVRDSSNMVHAVTDTDDFKNQVGFSEIVADTDASS